MDFPGHRQQRKVVFITVCSQFFRYLIDILPHIDDQTGCMVPVQLPCQIHPVFLLGKSQSCCHRKLLAPKVLNNCCIFQKMHPADRIRPAILSGQKFHLILLFSCQYHIFYCKTHTICLLPPFLFCTYTFPFLLCTYTFPFLLSLTLSRFCSALTLFRFFLIISYLCAVSTYFACAF